MYVCMSVCIVCMCVCMYVCMYSRMCVCVYVCTNKADRNVMILLYTIPAELTYGDQILYERLVYFT